MKTFRTSTGNAARNSIPLLLILATAISSLPAQAQQITTVSDGPAPLPGSAIGWWKADGSADDSAERNNGVATSISYTSGFVGQAFRFIGTDSFVRVPTHESLRTLTNVTLEAWVWNDQSKPFRRVLTLTPDHVILAIDQAGKPYLNVRFGDLAATATGQEFHDVTVSDSKTMTANTWHHLAGTYDGKSTRL
ncbi:MAG: hypothetical protein HY735_34325 [Verrucomicrobia bacterium]|nr:hypothetical protein [Verrucomicrobiota bacterium]